MRVSAKSLAPSAAVALLVLLICAVRLGLRVLPFRIFWRMVAIAARIVAPLSAASPSAVAAAVERATAYVPGTTCLAKALAAQVVLGQRSARSRLCIGVTKTPDGRFVAHAWVESDGRVVLGDAAALGRFTLLPMP